MNPSVWLTRPLADSQKLAGLLSSNHIPTFIAPVTRIVHCAWDRPKISTPDAIIITSKHAVYALETLPAHYRKVPIYCAGSTTAMLVQQHGFTAKTYANARAIEYALMQNLPQRAQLLYFSGKDISHPFVLAEHSLTRVVVYQAESIVEPPVDLHTMLRSGKLTAAMLFSVRHATLAGRWLVPNTTPLSAWCLSEQVAIAAKNAGFASCLVAAEPTTRAMVALATQTYPAMVAP